MVEKSKIKMAVFDIDGTIMSSNFTMSAKTKSSIVKAIDKGVKVVLATGRMYGATVPIASELGIKTPLITYQGSLVKEYCNSDDILLHYSILPDLSREVIADIRAFGFQINVYLDDELFIEDESYILVEYAKKRHITFHKIDSFDKVVNLKPTKILAISLDEQKTTELRDFLRKKYSNTLFISKSTPFYCEIVNKKASKGKAIKFLSNLWGIKKEEIMAVGDQDNDIDMFETAGLCVAMGNGTEELKNAANYITESVENDGVALAIDKFILGE